MLCSTLKNCTNFNANKILIYNLLKSNTNTMENGRRFFKKEPPVLRKDRLIKEGKRKQLNIVPGVVQLQVIGTGANGSAASVQLFTDNERYLFNCGEGTQRMAFDHKIKLSKMDKIFFTRNSWPMVGGFPGLALTVQENGARQLSLYGPPYFQNILLSMKLYITLNTLKIKTIDCTKDFDYEDSALTIKSIPLYRNDDENNAEPKRVDNSTDSIVMAYVCNLKPRPGTLNYEKCVEYGVRPGPLLGQLKNGIDVTLDNGKIVKSKDVSSPGDPPLTFAIIDIPHEGLLKAMENKLSYLHVMNSNSTDIACIIHFTPYHIVQNSSYQKFMQKFPKSTHHIFLNAPENEFSGFVSANRIQYKLNKISSRIFPLLSDSTFENEIIETNTEMKKSKLLENQHENIDIEKNKESINSWSVYHLRPRKGLDNSAKAVLNPKEYIQETEVLPDYPLILEKLKTDMKTIEFDESLEYPKLTFLGTGSCLPNKTRNVSGILMECQENAFILLDCGEGTYGQILRFFGQNKADNIIINLKAIYISHLHADHHLGILGVLIEKHRLIEERKCVDNSKILLFAPVQMKLWLEFYDSRIQYINNLYKLIGNSELLSQPLDVSTLTEGTGIDNIATCLVRHAPHSFGVAVTLNRSYDNGKETKPMKITYSGDTMPCQGLIDLGYKSTILIHEATMEDELLEQAIQKQHSTIKQSIESGLAMQADHIILTHFSQRYAKLPRLPNEKDINLKNVSIAFDNMQVTLNDLAYYHKFYPALKSLFAEYVEQMDKTAKKREQRDQLKRKIESI